MAAQKTNLQLRPSLSPCTNGGFAVLDFVSLRKKNCNFETSKPLLTLNLRKEAVAAVLSCHYACVTLCVFRHLQMSSKEHPFSKHDNRDVIYGMKVCSLGAAYLQPTAADRQPNSSLGVLLWLGRVTFKTLHSRCIFTPFTLFRPLKFYFTYFYFSVYYT